MSTREQLAVTYDVANDFFRLWLDERMIYTCALFESEMDTLEQAQVNKLSFFHDNLQVHRNSTILDIGCGWGGTIEYFCKDKGLRGTGITLSPSQYDEARRRMVDGMHFECISYQNYQPREAFDALISLGMFEHIATPEQARSNQDIDIYRDYFRKAWEWSKPGARFGLQSVIGGRIPRDRRELREMAWATYTIFPGAISPRLEKIIAAATSHWEVLTVHTRRRHYERTTAAWLQRLNRHAEQVAKRWGEKVLTDYRRYLEACVMAFSKGYQSLAQLILQRRNLEILRD